MKLRSEALDLPIHPEIAQIARRLDAVRHALRVTARSFAERMKEVSEEIERAKLALLELPSSEEWDRLRTPFKPKGDDS